MSTTTQLPAVLTDAMSTLDRALQNKTDPAMIERLYDMIDNIQMREAEKRFNVDFVAAQADMGPVSADATNPQTRSKYATYAQLDRAIRPVYTAHGFAVTFTEERTTTRRCGGSSAFSLIATASSAAIRSMCRGRSRACAAAMR
jgi:CRISPR/Cas system CSM-associated protein Csm2 small subunit